jgi:hypothetical protein
VTSLQSSVTSLQSTVTSLQSSVTSLQSTVASLQSSVTSLQSRVTALENAGPPGARNRYLGHTTATTNGMIQAPGADVGIASAAAICAGQFGAGAHMCTRDEVYESVAAGSTAFRAGVTVAAGWIYAPSWQEPLGAVSVSTPGTGTGDNCASYTYPTADTRQTGTTMEWKPWGAGRPAAILINGGSLAPCFQTVPIHCCR